MNIEERNYQTDPRVTCGEAPDQISFCDDDGEEHYLPHKWGVCGICGGEGKVVNPSIDAGGISSEEFNRDPEFADNYITGLFDITCPHCLGTRVVRVIDEHNCSEEEIEAYYKEQSSLASLDAESAAERAMGA